MKPSRSSQAEVLRSSGTKLAVRVGLRKELPPSKAAENGSRKSRVSEQEVPLPNGEISEVHQ